MIHFISRSGNYAIKITYIKNISRHLKTKRMRTKKKTLHISEKAKKLEKIRKIF